MRNAISKAAIALILLSPLPVFSETISILPFTDKGGSDVDNDGIYEDIEIETLDRSRVSDRGYDPYPRRVAMEFDLDFLHY